MFDLAICTDDIKLYLLLKNFLTRISYVGSFDFNILFFDSGEKLINYYKKGNSIDFHIVFLSVEMRKGLNGIEAAKKIRSYVKNKDAEMIFISYSMDKILDSFDVRPFYYFVRPIDYNLLEKKILVFYNELLSSIDHNLIVKSLNKHIILKHNDIIAITKKKEALAQKKLVVITKNNEYIFNGLLSEYINKLKLPFFLIHRSVIINFDYIKRIDSQNVTMLNNQVFPISKSKIKIFKEIYNKYIYKQTNTLI